MEKTILKNKVTKIFYVQNAIARLVAQKVIETYNFDKNECLFILGRNIRPKNFEYNYEFWDEFSIEYKLDFWNGKKKIENCHRNIEKFMLDFEITEFELYTSSMSFWFLETLALHKNCISFHFLEEGCGSLLSQKERERHQRQTMHNFKYYKYILKVLLHHNFKYYPNPFKTTEFLKNSTSIFTFTKHGFKDYPQKIMIETPFTYVEGHSNIKAVFAPSCLVENGLIPKDKYLKSIRELIEIWIKRDERLIHFKLHPQMLTKKKNLADYRNLFNEYSSEIQFIELKNVSLENIAFSSNANFYVGISSIAYYAKLCGSKVYSYYDILIKNYPKFGQIPISPILRGIISPENNAINKLIPHK